MSGIRTRDQLSSLELSPEPKHYKMADDATEQPTMEMVYQLLKEVQSNTIMLVEDNKQVRKEVQDLKQAMTFQMEKVEELNSENKKLHKQITQQEHGITLLNATIRQLNSKVEEIDSQQDALNQYSRKHNLVISGIPERSDEDLEEVVKELGDLLNVPVEQSDIDIVHRLKSKVSPKPIIVKFVQYTAKKDLYSARKKLRSLTPEKLEDTNCLYGASTIYINENLTAQRGALFAEVRKRTRLNKWHSTYTLDGKIYVKKYNGGRATKIEKEADMEDLYAD